MDKKKEAVWKAAPEESKESLPVVRRVRNACSQGEDLVAVTRLALEEIGRTKGFKHSPGLAKRVTGEVDGKQVEYGTWQAAYREKTDDVILSIALRSGCKHRWLFTWPQLKMYSYQVETCSCESNDL